MPHRLPALLLPVLIGCGGAPDPAQGETGAAPTDGAEAFGDYCVACHGADGGGGTGPPLSERVPGLDARALESLILEGTGTMPPIFVPEEERGPLIAHVLDTFG